MPETIKKIKQNTRERILDENIPYLEIITTAEVFNDAVRYIMKICPEIGISYDDFLYTMKVKQPPYSQVELNQAELWANADQAKRDLIIEADPEFDTEKIQSIVKEFEDRALRLAGFPVNLANTLYVKGFDNKKPNWRVTEFREIIHDALHGSKEDDPDYEKNMRVIKNTEYFILTEIFFRIFIKPQEAMQNCFFFNLYIGLLKVNAPFLNTMMPESLNSQIEK